MGSAQPPASYRPPAPQVPPHRPGSQAWVPIRSLAPRHRGLIRVHLLALDPQDRYLRFGYAAGEAQIERYVEALDFGRDEVFGIFNRKLELIAMAHLACEPRHEGGRPTQAEFGVSVLAKARGRGLGARLFDRAAMHARNRGIDTLHIHALSENTAMLRIARNAGAQIERDGPEATARVRLAPHTFASHVGALFETQAAEMDYQFKRNARQFTALMEAMRGGRT